MDVIALTIAHNHKKVSLLLKSGLRVLHDGPGIWIGGSMFSWT